MTQRGDIHLILGPMFSGKSTELIRLVKINKLIGRNCFVINHSFDNRFNKEAREITTHDGLSIPAFPANELIPLLSTKEVESADVVAINEGQFFLDLLYFCEECSKRGKNIIVCALRGDSENKMFRSISTLFPRATSINILSAKCLMCKDGTDAPFTACSTQKNDQVLVGGAEIYKAVCAKHYYEINK